MHKKSGHRRLKWHEKYMKTHKGQSDWEKTLQIKIWQKECLLRQNYGHTIRQKWHQSFTRRQKKEEGDKTLQKDKMNRGY